MFRLLLASKFATKALCAVGFVKAAPFVIPIACAAVCVGVTIAGAKRLSKKLSIKEASNVSPHRCAYFEDDYADENIISDNADTNESE